MRLIIIGNGFDLYHGLPSKYQDFANWLIENDPQLFESIGEYYDVPVCDESGYKVVDMFWSCFEKRLGIINTMAFEDQLLDDLSLENDDPISIGWQVNADTIAKNIVKRFSDWVLSSVDIDENYSIIKENLSRPIALYPNDWFVSFNYTHLLKHIYDIPLSQILYLHGECIDNDSSLIVGHGNDYAIKALKESIAEQENNYGFTQAESNRIDEKKYELSFLELLRKEISYPMECLKRFISNFPTPVDEIYFFGFSFGDVDLPYIETIARRFPEVSWNISYYKKDDKKEDHIREKIQGFTNDIDAKINFFPFINDHSETIRNLILEKKRDL